MFLKVRKTEIKETKTPKVSTHWKTYPSAQSEIKITISGWFTELIREDNTAEIKASILQLYQIVLVLNLKYEMVIIKPLLLMLDEDQPAGDWTCFYA